jgi:cell division protein FtsI/penicillin-binding protein 2
MGMLRLLRAISLVVLVAGIVPETVSAPGVALRAKVPGSVGAAVVLEISAGHVVARSGDMRVAGAPGSLLKPFLLAYALEHGVVQPSDKLWCRRSLHIQGKDFSCRHPNADSPLTLEQALAYSCNSAFAELARRLGPDRIESALAAYSIPVRGISQADSEALPLYALGVRGTAMTPLEVAEAYRRLAQDLAAAGLNSRLRTVQAGLEQSVLYGAASNARLPNVSVAGKTGTASDGDEQWTHGWFAGYVPSAHPKYVVVVYVRRGNGADAAHLAHDILLSQGVAR